MNSVKRAVLPAAAVIAMTAMAGPAAGRELPADLSRLVSQRTSTPGPSGPRATTGHGPPTPLPGIRRATGRSSLRERPAGG